MSDRDGLLIPGPAKRYIQFCYMDETIRHILDLMVHFFVFSQQFLIRNIKDGQNTKFDWLFVIWTEHFHFISFITISKVEFILTYRSKIAISFVFILASLAWSDSWLYQ